MKPDLLIDLLRGFDRFSAAPFFNGRTDRYPRFLYQYHGPTSKGLEGVIVRSELWRSSPNNFNDIHELAANLTFAGTPKQRLASITSALRGKGVPSRRRRELAMKIFRDKDLPHRIQLSFDKGAREFGITCFASDPRSALMWAHYADRHRGVCFQFHCCEAPIEFCQAFPVVYTDEVLNVEWTKLQNREGQLAKVFFREHKEWAYEGEHRMIENRAANSPMSMNPMGLRGIILGAQATPETVERIRELLEERSTRRLPPVRLYRASKKVGSYELSISCVQDHQRAKG